MVTNETPVSGWNPVRKPPSDQIDVLVWRRMIVCVINCA